MKTIIVMPAYQAEKTLKETVETIPEGCFEEIILVDDASDDETVAVAKQLGIKVFVNELNLGYGGNQKRCYKEALNTEAEVIVMLHPDNQYDARLIPFFKGFVENGICDMMLGSRIRTRKEALEGGMPFYKYLMNRLLSLMMNIILGQNLAEMHSGFRIYHRKVLENIVFEDNADDFVFDAQLIAQAVQKGFKLGDAPMPVRYFPEASSIGFKDSVIYGVKILGLLGLVVLHQLKLKKASLFRDKGAAKNNQ